MIVFCEQYPFAKLTMKTGPVQFCVGISRSLLKVHKLLSLSKEGSNTFTLKMQTGLD